MLEVTIENKKISIDDNQSIEDIVHSNFTHDDVVAAKIDNQLVDLSNTIEKNCKIHHKRDRENWFNFVWKRRTRYFDIIECNSLRNGNSNEMRNL